MKKYNRFVSEHILLKKMPVFLKLENEESLSKEEKEKKLEQLITLIEDELILEKAKEIQLKRKK